MKIYLSEILVEALNEYDQEILLKKKGRYVNVKKDQMERIIVALHRYKKHCETLGMLYEYVDLIHDELNNISFLMENIE